MSELSPLEEVRRFFRDYALESGRPLVVAVSGGPDSVCLLRCLSELRAEFSLDLHVAHLDHRLRGADSEADAAFVKHLAKDLGLPVTIEARDVDSYRHGCKLSLEEAAREVRYQFLEAVAEKVGAGAVAVGHTADDRAETVLMNLLRGAGTKGLRGLLPVASRRGDRDLTILRPLLNIRHDATVAYCHENGLNPRQDDSNYSTDFTRNRIRHSLIPVLKEYNPRIVESLLRTALIAQDDTSYLDAEVEKHTESVLTKEGESVAIDKAVFRFLQPALKRGILRAAVLAVHGTLKNIEAGHIEDMLTGTEKQAGKTIELPGGMCFIVEYDRYLLSPDKDRLCPGAVLEGEIPLNVPGTTALPGWTVTADILDGMPERGSSDDAQEAFFDVGFTGTDLRVRTRKPGDRFIPLGMKDEKKLNVFMIDEKIPRSRRRCVPLVTNDRNILWVVGYRIDNRFRVTDTTGQVLRLLLRPAV